MIDGDDGRTRTLNNEKKVHKVHFGKKGEETVSREKEAVKCAMYQIKICNYIKEKIMELKNEKICISLCSNERRKRKKKRERKGRKGN